MQISPEMWPSSSGRSDYDMVTGPVLQGGEHLLVIRAGPRTAAPPGEARQLTIDPRQQLAVEHSGRPTVSFADDLPQIVLLFAEKA